VQSIVTESSDDQPRVIQALALPKRDPARACLDLDAHIYGRAMDCVHCGLCLPACPTYTQNGLEADSPRGRIYLMKGMADGTVDPTENVLKHLDLCLDCQACETACPSGVVYHELLEETRDQLAKKRKLSLVDRLVQLMFLHIFTRPWRLKVSLLPLRLLQRAGIWKLLTGPAMTRLLPKQLDKMQQMLPPTGPLWERNLDEVYPAIGEKKATVGFFPGCVGSVLFQDVNRQSIDLLRRAGCEVVIPKGIACCGAIHHHNGHTAGAQGFMRKNIDLFVPKATGKPVVDYVVNAIAGCGAALRDCDHLMRHDAQYAQRAEQFAAISRDISEVLVDMRLAPPQHKLERTVTYHHACHLAHAQKVTNPPLQLLRMIDGLTIVPLVEADYCCGAAGTYNLTQPQMARELADRKIRHIQETGASYCVTGNVGCAMQIQSEADRLKVKLKAVHPVALLHEAYFGDGVSHNPDVPLH
jgi:glycolate oxidase iron-sulfur subunit